jgi:hypothetical protein
MVISPVHDTQEKLTVPDREPVIASGEVMFGVWQGGVAFTTKLSREQLLPKRDRKRRPTYKDGWFPAPAGRVMDFRFHPSVPPKRVTCGRTVFHVVPSVDHSTNTPSSAYPAVVYAELSLNQRNSTSTLAVPVVVIAGLINLAEVELV